MALAFIGSVPAGEEVSHLDENRANDNLSNIGYETPVENNNRPKHLKRLSEAHRKKRLTNKYRKRMDKFFNSSKRWAMNAHHAKKEII